MLKAGTEDDAFATIIGLPCVAFSFRLHMDLQAVNVMHDIFVYDSLPSSHHP